MECLACASGASKSTDGEAGMPGASARREFERRSMKREERILSAHPKLGRIILAVTDEPQSTKAWRDGAVGEELLAKRLDRLSDRGVLMLHDRRIRGTKANIDHIAVSPAGVFVIDAKRYTGRPRLQVEGGLLRPRTETLVVGRRTCTALVEGMRKQVNLVRAALPPDTVQPAVRGMLCFVEADWPLIGGNFVMDGIDILWPKKAQEAILAAGVLTPTHVAEIHRVLAVAFPVA